MACRLYIDINGVRYEFPSESVFVAWALSDAGSKVLIDAGVMDEQFNINPDFLQQEAAEEQPSVTGEAAQPTPEVLQSINDTIKRVRDNPNTPKDLQDMIIQQEIGVYDAMNTKALLDYGAAIYNQLKQNMSIPAIVDAVMGNSDILLPEKLAILSAIVQDLETAKNNKDLTTEQRQALYNEQYAPVLKALSSVSNQAGQALNLLQSVFVNTPEMLSFFIQDQIEKEYFKGQKKQDREAALSDIMQEVLSQKDNTETMLESLDKLSEEGGISKAIEEEIKSLQDEIADLKERIAEVEKGTGRKRSKAGQKIKRLHTKEQIAEYKKRLRGQLNAGVDLEALLAVAYDTLLDGAENIADFYSAMSKAIGNKFSPYFKGAYYAAVKQAKEQAASEGIENDMAFSTEEEVEAFDATYIAELQQKIKEKEERIAKAKKVKKATNITDALKEAGYYTERVIKGKTTKVIDWQRILGDAEQSKSDMLSKVQQLLEQQNISPEEISDFLQAVSFQYDKTIAQKKADKINNVLKEKNLPAPKLRVSETQALADFVNMGDAVTPEILKSALGKKFGLTSLSEQELVVLQELSRQASLLPVGSALKSAALERLEWFLYTRTNLKTTAWTKFFNNVFLANLLTSPVTLFKNSMGVLINAPLMAGTTLIREFAKTGKVDKKYLDAFLNSYKEGLKIAPDIWNGGVERAQSLIQLEEGGKYKINPRALLMMDLPNGLNGLRNALAKSLSVMSMADAIHTTIASNMRYYSLTKDKYMDMGYSATEASKMAYDALNYEYAPNAVPQAESELKTAGILPTDKGYEAMLNRRAFEIAREKRESTEAKEKSESFAMLEAYKSGKPTGIADYIGWNISKILSATNKISGDKTKVQRLANEVIRSFSSSFIPFINGVSQVVEFSMNSNPLYGGTKYAAYTVYAQRLAKKIEAAKNENDLKEVAKLSEKLMFLQEVKASTINQVGSFVLLTGLLFSVAAVIRALSGDDDEPLVQLTGTTEQGKNSPRDIVRGQRTIKIYGLGNLGTEFFSHYGLTALIMAQAVENYENEMKKPESQRDIAALEGLNASLNAVFVSLIQQTYFKSFKDMASLFSGDESGSTFRNRFFASYLANRLPLTGISRAVQTEILDQESTKEAKSFSEQILKNFGFVTAWALDRDMIDYRGRKVVTAEKYNTSLRSLIQGVSEGFTDVKRSPQVDEIDKWLLDVGFLDKMPKIEGQDSPSMYKFALVQPDGTFRYMTDEEYWEFKKRAGEKFDTAIRTYYNKVGKRTAADKEENAKAAEDIYKEAVDISLFEQNLKLFGGNNYKRMTKVIGEGLMPEYKEEFEQSLLAPSRSDVRTPKQINYETYLKFKTKSESEKVELTARQKRINELVKNSMLK